MGQIMSVMLFILSIILLASNSIGFDQFKWMMLLSCAFGIAGSISSISLYLKDFKDNLFFMSAEKQELTKEQKEKIDEIVSSRK